MSFVGKSMGRSSDGPIGETIHWKLLNSHLCIFYPASNLCFLLLTQLCAAVKWKIADVSLLDILFLHFPFPSNFLPFCAFSHLMFHLASIKCQYFIYILDDRLLSGSPPGQCPNAFVSHFVGASLSRVSFLIYRRNNPYWKLLIFWVSTQVSSFLIQPIPILLRFPRDVVRSL